MNRPLAHLKLPVEQSRGRRYPELPHPYRQDFQRDRDRIIHARSFRRLENKTQVFPPGISDHFRNRLTHTLEVAQIARTVASALGLDEDLTEALALVHDIGHPPFGHAGEDELNRQMQRFGDRFDHNLHALRIVDQLEQRYALFPGLNLTFEVREGIVKHSRDLRPGELPEFLPEYRPPLEAQLIDIADEIAYNTADLDDADSAGLVPHEALFAAVPEAAALWERAESQYPAAAPRVLFHEMLRGLIDQLVSGLIAGTVAAAAGLADVTAVRREASRVARMTPDAARVNAALKRFLHERVYESEELVAERGSSIGHVAELFDYYLARPGELPEHTREALASEPLHRVVCDYIAGMTDRYFHRVYFGTVSPE